MFIRATRTGTARDGSPRLTHRLVENQRRDGKVRQTTLLNLTPPSARFFGRRFRVAPLFVMVNALMLAGGAGVEALACKWGIPVRTVRRWRRWWRESFPATRAWRWKRGELAVPGGEAPLVCVLRAMRGRSLRSRLLRSLIWLLPWTGFCALADGRSPSAESGSSRNG